MEQRVPNKTMIFVGAGVSGRCAGNLRMLHRCQTRLFENDGIANHDAFTRARAFEGP